MGGRAGYELTDRVAIVTGSGKGIGAGICVFEVDIEDLTEEQWRTVLGVNLDGVFFCTQSIMSLTKGQR